MLSGGGPGRPPVPSGPSIHAPGVSGDEEWDDEWDDEWVEEAHDQGEDDRWPEDSADRWLEDDPPDEGGAGNGWVEDDPDGGTQAYPALGERFFDPPPDDDRAPDRRRRPAPARAAGPPPPGPPRRPPNVPRAVVLKHRRRRRRFLIGLTFFLSASVTFTGSGYVYLQYRLGQIPRVDVPSLVGDDPNGVMNVLLVGSDSRAGLQGEDALQAGTVSGQRSDTIMVLHIDQKQEQAAILSVPRDLFLPIAGEGYSDRVNAAFAINGPQGLSETIQEALGITINHYVEVDFVGFKDIVDAVGGVQLYLPAWVRDQTSGLDLPKIGCVNVDGTQGLAWVRSRDFEILQPDGLTWSTDPRADLGRIERQQDFIRRMLKKALSSGLTNPIQLNRLIGIGVRDVTLDETLSTKDITTLARRFNNLDPDSVALLTLPTTPTDIDGKAVLELREDDAQPYLDRMNGVVAAAGAGSGTPDSTTTTLAGPSLLPPGEVDVRVLNGEGTPGTAARAAAALQGAGFTVSGTGDATEIGRTTIRYPAVALAQAQLLDGALVGGADLIVDDTVTSTDLILVIGADYQGLKPGPVPPVPRPSTTVATGAAGTGSTTTTAVPTTTAPPTTAGPPTLPPGVEC